MALPSFLRAYFHDVEMLQTAKDVSALNPLVDLFELIESFLKHLDICTFVPHTSAMTETAVKTVVELLSILGLATKLVKQRQPGEHLLAGILSDSVQRRDICKQALWREFRSDGAGKVESTHPGRGPGHHIADCQGRLWSCPEYEGCHGW
jgi:hypothetical protein